MFHCCFSECATQWCIMVWTKDLHFVYHSFVNVGGGIKNFPFGKMGQGWEETCYETFPQ